MGKDPAFLFYPNDWMGGTMGFTFEQKGAYMELLMMQFNRGHMTLDMIRHTVGQHWDTVQVKFVQDGDGLWYNERLELEKKRRQNYVESRNNNKKGKNQHTQKGKNNSGHMTSHMENENEDVNKDSSFGKSENLLKEILSDQIWLEQFQMKYRSKVKDFKIFFAYLCEKCIIEDIDHDPTKCRARAGTLALNWKTEQTEMKIKIGTKTNA